MEDFADQPADRPEAGEHDVEPESEVQNLEKQAPKVLTSPQPFDKLA